MSPAYAERIPDAVDKCSPCGISMPECAPYEGRAGSQRKMPEWLIRGLFVAGGLGILFICVEGPVALLLPILDDAREAARRSQCKNNLKQIGQALHNYHDTFGAFPPAYIPDKDGKPMHSWRVLILPYIDQLTLYNQYSFSEPWDGPNNSRLLAQMPAVYAGSAQTPSDTTPPLTTTAYAGVFGERCVFRGSESISIKHFTHGAATTLIVGEAVKSNIPWMKPEDIDVNQYPTIGGAAGFGSNDHGGAHFLLGDGTVRFISASHVPKTLQSLFAGNAALPDVPICGDF